MKDLIIFYLLTGAPYTFPTLFIAVSLLQGTPLSFLPKLVMDLPPVQRAIRNSGIARLGQYFQLLNPDLTDYIRHFYVLAACSQLATIALNILAITYEVPFPFVSDVNTLLKPGGMSKLWKFGLLSSAILLIPFVIFITMGIHFDSPFISKAPPVVIRTPNSLELGCWAKRSKKFAVVHIRRFEDSEKIVIFITVRSNQLRKTRKIVLCQGKEDGARSECYMYNRNQSIVRKITPVPITVDDVEEVFNIGD